MKELVEVIAKSLVDHPEDVRVEEEQEDRQVTLKPHVDEDDMGKVIGRQGRIVKEIRILMRAVAQRQGKKVSVDIMD